MDIMAKPLKIALVEATSSLTHVYSRTSLPRVGLATLGAILLKEGYHCDLWINPLGKDDRDNLGSYDIVGIGSLSSTINEAYMLADELRNKNVTVVIGGPHASFMPEEALEHCSYVVTGEGEAVFPALVKSIECGQHPEPMNGLSFRNDDGIFSHGGMAENVDFASVPSPDFLMSSQITGASIPPIVVTSRGCPHDCSFCSVTPLFGRKYRFKSNEQVISEIRPIQHKSVCFGDDNFCANPVRTKALLREMIAQKAVPLRWSGQMCVNAASDPELLSLMQETQCRIVYVGIESVDPGTLKKYGKAHQLDAVQKCVKNLHDHNIGIHGMFVVDSHDGPDAPKNIVDYAMDIDIDTIQVFSITPFPGTRSYRENKDRIIHTDWSKYDGMHVVVTPTTCSPYSRQMSIVNEMKRFYSLKRCATAYRKNRAWRMKYRFGGHILIQKWVAENMDYIKKLSSLTNE
jgi:radical SAM superfamily enzyme YgiQ (UPF0313 family)